MDIRCERCRAEYRFKDDAIGPAGLTVRCSKCGHVFKVRRPVSGAAVPVAEAGWTLRKKRTGDVYAVTDLAQLQRWVAERRAIRDDEASVGGGSWRRLGDIPELAAAFAVAQAARRSAPGTDESGAGVARREAAHTTSVFPGPGRPPAPMHTEIAYQVPEAPGSEATEPAWAQEGPAPDRGPARTPRFTPGDEDRPRLDREPAFTEPEPTLRDARGGLPLTGSAPLTTEEPAPLSALIDERPPPTRAAPRPRRRSPVATVIGVVAVLITLVALGGVAVALLKPEWLDPLFSGLDVTGVRKLPSASSPDAPVPGTNAPATPVPNTSVGTPNGASAEGAPAGSSRAREGQSRTLSTSVPGTQNGNAPRAAEAVPPSGSNRGPVPAGSSGPEAPTGAMPAPAPSPAAPAMPDTPGAASSALAEGPASKPAARPAEPQADVAGVADAAPAPVPSKPVPGTAAGTAARVPGTAPSKPVAGTDAAETAPAPATSARPSAPNVAGAVPGTGHAGHGTEQGAAQKSPLAGVPSTAGTESASAMKAVAPAPPPTPAKPAAPKLTGVAAQLAQARLLRARGRADVALDVYGQILDKEPQNPDALAGRGLCYFDLGRTSKAEEAFKSALSADPKNGDALLGLAETYRYDSRREDALAYYEKYLEAHPRGPGASIARANIQALNE